MTRRCCDTELGLPHDEACPVALGIAAGEKKSPSQVSGTPAPARNRFAAVGGPAALASGEVFELLRLSLIDAKLSSSAVDYSTNNANSLLDALSNHGLVLVSALASGIDSQLDDSVARALTKACERQGLVCDLVRFVKDLGEWLVAIVPLDQIDPPVCRLQFPDGSVPGNAREAAEGWHEVAQDRGQRLNNRASDLTTAQLDLESARDDVARLTAILSSPTGAVNAAKCEVVDWIEENCCDEWGSSTIIGTACDQAREHFCLVKQEIESPAKIDATAEIPVTGAEDGDGGYMGSAEQPETLESPQIGFGLPAPDEPTAENREPRPQGTAPFEFEDRVRSLNNPGLGAMLVAQQTVGEGDQWSVVCQPIGGTALINFPAAEVELAPTRPIVTLDNGDKVDLGKFSEEMRRGILATALSMIEAIGQGNSFESGLEQARRVGGIDATQK